MNATQLLATLPEGYTVGSPVDKTKQLGIPGLKVYMVPVLVPNGDTVTPAKFAYVVKDNGDAFWYKRNPVPTTPDPDIVTPALKNYLNQLLQNGDLFGILTISVNVLAKNALVEAIVEDSGNYSKKEVYVYIDANNQKQYVILS